MERKRVNGRSGGECEGGDGGRYSSLEAGERRRSPVVPGGDSQGVRWADAAGAGSVCGRGRRTSGSTATGLRRDCDRHQSRWRGSFSSARSNTRNDFAGKKHPLPDFALRDADFMAEFFKEQGFKGAMLRTLLQRLGHGDGGEVQLDLISVDDPLLDADLAWHMRAWGRWVLARARKRAGVSLPHLCRVHTSDRWQRVRGATDAAAGGGR